MENSSTHLVLAFYLFTDIPNPKTEVTRFQKFLKELDIKGRIYINEKGINAQMSILREDAQTFNNWFFNDVKYQNVDIKVQDHSEHSFPKLTIKYRKQLAAMDRDFDLTKSGVHISSSQWLKMIEEKDENTLILDVRNDYEWEVGHFEGAKKPMFKTFREFPSYLEKLKKTHNPAKTKIMMYCTGGIRCEMYSCIFKDEGFEKIYQLEGGVIKYGKEQGSKYWKGKVFVFDDRLVVPISSKESSETISHCIHCNKKSDLYYNCANMECNNLFLSCIECVTDLKGCCCKKCTSQPRLRVFNPSTKPRPYRKLSQEEKLRVVSSFQ